MLESLLKKRFSKDEALLLIAAGVSALVLASELSKSSKAPSNVKPKKKRRRRRRKKVVETPISEDSSLKKFNKLARQL